jgi:hypothetical protein
MPSPADRLIERLDLEEPLLIATFPNGRLDRNTNTVILADQPLPTGWSHESSDILVAFPPNYPAGCPDNVCSRPDLSLANGQLPGNNQGIQTHAGRAWLQLSWHIDPGEWAPTADPRQGSNLVTYLFGALTRFEEAS